MPSALPHFTVPQSGIKNLFVFPEECEELSENTEGMLMPLLALRGIVVFPGAVASFEVTRPKSANAINKALKGNRLLLAVTQKDYFCEQPEQNELYGMGCVVCVKQILKISDSVCKVLVEGLYRADYTAFDSSGDYCTAVAFRCEDTVQNNTAAYKEALLRRIKLLFHKYISVLQGISPDAVMTVDSSNDIGTLSDFITFNINAPFDDKQLVLEQLSPVKRGKTVCELLDKEREIGEIDRRIDEKTRMAIDENQREYYLREQMHVISTELYGDDTAEKIEDYYAKIDALSAEPSVKEALRSHVAKLAKMPNGSHEGTVERGYLDTCLELPWNARTAAVTDLARAEKILNRDIFGMDKVKERILELLSVYLLSPDIKGQIICLAGPPGVGKTSIGKTIAECMGRRFARISLGGVHDEAEIRGHRKTYIGAMPGKIINALKQAGSANPLILLDEIDKLGGDYKGDPSSAMLEVLDPEQNSSFVDHFVELPFDLSGVVFIATANNLDTVPPPLRDRMEIIELTGYSREEKFGIAKHHLAAKQIQRHGMKKSQLRITDSAIYSLIDFYTREAGVRQLERSIASLCRKSARLIATGEKSRVTVNAEVVERMLGKHRYRPEAVLDTDEVGLINGLAWTSVGGTVMQLEVAVMQGSGKVEFTGSLGEVMVESAKTAVSYVRANAEKYAVNPEFYKKLDIHIHATEAAVPKDGPSAGVTITTALISALTGRAVRRDIAMTGEISLRGRVLPIGGLKEKTMAAYTCGVKTVFFPKENVPDLDEVDAVVKENTALVPVSHIDEIIEKALLPIYTPNLTDDKKWNTALESAADLRRGITQ